jgi:hypothetical protein
MIEQIMGKKMELSQPLKTEQMESLLKLLVYVVLDKQDGVGMLESIKKNTKLRDYLFGHWDLFGASRDMMSVKD